MVAETPAEAPRALLSERSRRRLSPWQLMFRGFGLAGLFLTGLSIFGIGNLASGLFWVGLYGCALLVPLTGLLCLAYVFVWPTFEKSRIEAFDWILLLAGVGALALLSLGFSVLASMACCP